MRRGRSGGRRRPLWAMLWSSGALGALVLGVWVHLAFLGLVGVLAGGAYAAWLGLGFWRYVDTLDDTTAPPTAPG